MLHLSLVWLSDIESSVCCQQTKQCEEAGSEEREGEVLWVRENKRENTVQLG